MREYPTTSEELTLLSLPEGASRRCRVFHEHVSESFPKGKFTTAQLAELDWIPEAKGARHVLRHLVRGGCIQEWVEERTHAIVAEDDVEAA